MVTHASHAILPERLHDCRAPSEPERREEGGFELGAPAALVRSVCCRLLVLDGEMLKVIGNHAFGAAEAESEL